MAQNGLVAIEICLAEGKPEARGADPGGSPAGKDHLHSLADTREAPGRQERTNWTACEAPGRQERINWTAWEAPGRHQGGRKGLIGQPARHQGGTREAGKDLWTAWEAPGRHQGLLKANLFDGKAWCQV